MGENIFKGIDKSEIQQFSERLAFERTRDHRFAAIQIKGNTIAEKDIVFYKTAFEACKHILMAPTDNGLYAFRSMSLLQDDVKRILEGKTIEKEIEIKKSKGLDLEK
ncbi:MAG TPA: hypothetical protein PKE30_01635 [Niabella sp.]|nr:hypothetical protein [Niabella sp.]